MSHINIGMLVIAFPIGAVLFGLFAMGILTFRKLPPEEAKPKPANLRPPPRPPKKAEPEPELTEKEKRRAERRAKRREL